MGVTSGLIRKNCQLRTGGYNCEGFLSAAAYIVDLLEDLNVLFLSETWVSRAEATLLGDVLRSYGVNSVQIFQTFAMDAPPGAGEGRRQGGTAMICRVDGQFTFSQLQTGDSRLLAVRLSIREVPHLTIIGCYMPYFNGTNEQLEYYRDTCASLEAIICAHRAVAPLMLVGDFNCQLPRLSPAQRPTEWAQLRGFTAFSREFQRVLDENDLVVAEFCFSQATDCTYERGGHRTHIDHIVVPRSFVGSQLRSCKIVSPCPDNLSPHLPLRCTLTLTITGEGVKGPPSRVQSSTSHRTVLDWSSSDRNDAYRRRLTELLAQRIPVCSNAEQLDAQLTASIHEAAADTGCSRRWRPPKPWWTPAISAARDRARFWHRLWTDAGRPRNTVLHNCFRAARSSYRRARVDAARAKADSGARLLSVLRRDKNIKAFWRRVESSRRGSDVSRSVLTADDFENHFSPIHMDNEVLSPEHEEVCRRVATLLAEARSNPGPDRRVSADDVARLIGQLNRDASPGPDGVTAEHLLYGSSPTLLHALASILNASLAEMRVPTSFTSSTVVPLIKKSSLDPDCADNYRPISLVSTVSKLLELILLDEIGESFQPSELQFGFLPHRGTREASMLVQETAQHHLSQNSPLFTANLDARKCFDRIWHAGVLLRSSDHLSRRSFALLANWYRGLTARVRFDGVMSHAFPVRRGVRQGALMSPCLTNMFLLPLIQQLDDGGLGSRVHGHHVPVVAYADDLLLMSSGVRDLQTMLDMVSNFSVNWRLEFVHPNPSLTKSHCFIFGAELLAMLPVWRLCGQTLAVRRETEHLGVQLRSQLQGADHVNARIRRGRGAFFGLMPAGMFNANLLAIDKAYLWRSVVAPAMLYGCSTCLLRSSDISRMESWQATSIKAALRLPRIAHHTALLAALQIPSVQDVLRRSVFGAFRDTFRDNHRLRSIIISSLAREVTHVGSTGSLVSYMMSLCGGKLETLLEVAGGYLSHELVSVSRPACGITDSLRWLLSQNSADAWSLIKLIVVPRARTE